VDLSRPPEPFQRVYSAPEPPAVGRRPRVLAALVAVVSFVLAAGAMFAFAPGGEKERTGTPGRTLPGDSQASAADPGGTSTPSATTPSPATSEPSAMPSGPEPVTALPPACGTVQRGTVARMVPDARQNESANTTLTTCTYSSRGEDFRWLRIETHLYAPGNTETPVEDARGYFDAQWEQARGAQGSAALERTVSLGRERGLGDEAFRWFKIDKGQPTVVGQVTVRVRNVVVTVGYSEQAGDADAAEERERACLANATAVAREVLGRFG
jgi:hypothetical protein